jgi:hypothetical protein
LAQADRSNIQAGTSNQRSASERSGCSRKTVSLDPQATTGGMPAWSGLPTEIQAALTNLMTRLILEHADKNRIGSKAEAGHDL